MKHRQILIRGFLAILCLPLSACLYNVSGTSGAQYPIGGDGVVDLTSLTELENLKLGGINMFATGSFNVSLECKSQGLFTPLNAPNITNTTINVTMPSDFWGSVVENCDRQQDGENYLIELALRLGDNYVPVFTQDNLMCVVSAIMVERKLLKAVRGCIAADPRGTGVEPYSVYGVNSTVHGINILKLLVPQEAL
jgi:hypothetical protein